MAFDGQLIVSLLDRIGNKNAAGEYYLTDVVEVARTMGHRVAYELIAEEDVHGVNTRQQLSEAEAIIQNRLRLRAMDGGATLISPSTVTFSHDTVVGQDVMIEPNVVFGLGVVFRGRSDDKGVLSHRGQPHRERRNGRAICSFAARHTPWRQGSYWKFRRIKTVRHQIRAKVNHLSYVGDTEVGKGAIWGRHNHLQL